MGWSPGPTRWRSAVLCVVVAATASGCVGGGDGASTAQLTTTRPDATTEPPVDLEVVDGTTEVYCDGADRPVANIRGAAPGERLVLSSPQPVQLTADHLDATADATGAYELRWRCSASEAGQPWELRVEGEDSGRGVTVSFTGSATDPDAVDALQIVLDEETFPCDGTTGVLGELSNAEPFEAVRFTAENADELVDGTADAEGRVTLRWQCGPDEATTWVVTAEGLQSNRVGRFTIVGSAPSPEEIPTPTFDAIEDPFLCDGGTRPFATLSGFVPGETVEFVSPQASDLTVGEADGSGVLTVRWTCDRADLASSTEPVWQLTATGVASGRTVTFAVTGAAPPPAPDPIVTFVENPFGCDDTTRFFATISGFVPREFVDFDSPQVEDLRQGQADETGTLQVRWTCGIGDVGRTWDVTATGATSKLSASFQITGAAPEP